MFGPQSRRDLLARGSYGLGAIALWHVLCQDGRSRAPAITASARAKNIIFMFMMGGQSHLDLFDPKPKMAALNGQPIPDHLTKAKKSATGGVLETIQASPRRFRPYGQSGIELSELIPHTAEMADELCLIRSMHCEQSNHDPAQLLLHCGTPQFGAPSIGSWVTYGLGSECQDMPGYMVLTSDDGHGLEGAGSSIWGSGFMPASYRGVTFRNSSEPVLYLANPTGVSFETQRARLDVLQDLNRLRKVSTRDAEIDSRIASYEMAFRMQTAAPELLDFSQETANTKTMYGLDSQPTRSFGSNCLLARRMVERGVRFVHLVHSTWDHHSDLTKRIANNCKMTDQPAAALLKDLKQRGLLDETLVV